MEDYCEENGTSMKAKVSRKDLGKVLFKETVKGKEKSG
jgi:hypothetical protein